MDISAEIAAIQAASQGSELRQPLVGALNKLNSGTLPTVTASDVGKILKVGTNGWEVGEKSGYIPITQADEGKVVLNGALTAQGSQTITQNGVYDTTLKDSVTVNVGSGGDAVEPIDQFEILALNNTLSTFVDKYGNNSITIANSNKCMLFRFTGSFSNNSDVVAGFSLTKAQAEELVGKYVNLKTYGTYSRVSVTGIIEQTVSPWTRVAIVNQESARSVIQSFPSGSYNVNVYLRVRGSANTSIDAYFALTVTDS